MISIIVSTYKPDNFLAFVENIKLNIGVEYEIIRIENKGVYGLCEAYNMGIEQAKYPYICFSHDDIHINRKNWGQYVINEFEKSDDIGLLGVAGCTYKTYSPSGWFFPNDILYQRADIFHLDKSDSSKYNHLLSNPPLDEDVNIREVVVLDGCWLFTSKKITDEYRFSEQYLKGYHCYDLDYSFQVGLKYKLATIYNLNLIHFSEGNFGKEWAVETFKLHEKWKSRLPISIPGEDTSSEEKAKNEYLTFQYFIDKASNNNVYLYPLLKLLQTFRLISLMGVSNWLNVYKWTLGVIFRTKKS